MAFRPAGAARPCSFGAEVAGAEEALGTDGEGGSAEIVNACVTVRAIRAGRSGVNARTSPIRAAT
ncbi:hypothetical protein [Novosphingobium guangzhouense]|uniref:hypothetical protein n=1 Tax=Novosphingobium guangzhouense TaxID=1850347 RepID=UPI001FE451E0|nr:hypothetical protein [Novosphingobium guangzhouense]